MSDAPVNIKVHSFWKDAIFCVLQRMLLQASSRQPSENKVDAAEFGAGEKGIGLPKGHRSGDSFATSTSSQVSASTSSRTLGGGAMRPGLASQTGQQKGSPDIADAFAGLLSKDDLGRMRAHGHSQR